MSSAQSTARTSARPASTVSAAPGAARDWLALAVLAMAEFMVILDASVVNVALPSIGSALHLNQRGLSWVVNAYVLTFGGLLLLGGRLADLLGRRRIFVAGAIAFSAASLLGGFAQTEAELIAARALQGGGAALLAPAALALVASTFREGARRTKAMGIWGAVAGSGAAAGVLLGGVLTSAFGWRWVLFINVPVGLVCIVAIPFVVPESRADRSAQSFDLSGAAAITGGLGALVYALVGVPSAGWASVRTLGLLGGAAILLAAFIVRERRARTPLVPFRIFTIRTLAVANAVMILVGAAVLSLFFVLSLYMQQVLGYSPLKAGVTQLPLAGAIVVVAGATPALVARLGLKTTMLTGIVALGSGLVWFSRISVHGSFASDILGPSLLVALGLGVTFVVLTTASVSGVHEHESGLASGLINTTQQVGGSLGLAIVTTIASTRTAHALIHGTGRSTTQALTDGFQWAFLGAAGFAGLAFLIAAFTKRWSAPRPQRRP